MFLKLARAGQTTQTISNKIGQAVSVGGSFITATGGTITTSGDYKIHKFTSNGTFEVTSGSGNVEYLVVGGGSGGGGSKTGNAGGAGGGEQEALELLLVLVLLLHHIQLLSVLEVLVELEELEQGAEEP